MAKKSKKAPLIKKHGAMVIALAKSPKKFRTSLIREAPVGVIKCISECCQNLLKGNVPLSVAQKRRLYSKRQHLRQIASKSVSVPEKRKKLNQSGGFLPFLIPIIAKTVLGSVLGR